jgi:hypothetical protein
LIVEENADRRFGAPRGASELEKERRQGRESVNLQPQLLVRKKKRRKRKGGRG